MIKIQAPNNVPVSIEKTLDAVQESSFLNLQNQISLVFQNYGTLATTFSFGIEGLGESLIIQQGKGLFENGLV